MQVEVDITESDVIAARKLITKWMRSRLNVRYQILHFIKRLGVWTAVGIVIMGMSNIALGISPPLWFVFVLIALVSSAAIYSVLAVPFRKQLELMKGVLGHHIFELRDEGLYEETDANSTLTKWAGLHSVRKDASRIYVVAGGLNVYVIPMKFFPTEQEACRFYESLASKVLSI